MPKFSLALLFRSIIFFFGILFCMVLSLPVDGQVHSTEKKKEVPSEHLFTVISGPDQPVIDEGMPGTKNILGGFEGGRSIKINGIYHLFPTERAGEKDSGAYYDRVKTRIGHWISKDAIHWRRDCMYKSTLKIGLLIRQKRVSAKSCNLKVRTNLNKLKNRNYATS